MSDRSADLANLPPDLEYQIVGVMEEDLLEFRKAFHRFAGKTLAAVTPRGPDDKNRRGHPGLLRASWIPGKGEGTDTRLPLSSAYAEPDDLAIDAAQEGLGLGEDFSFTNNASDTGTSSYAQIIWEGRRTDKNGRAIGSLQAPDGIGVLLEPQLNEFVESYEWP